MEPEPVVFEVRQSAGIYALFVVLGLAIGLLLVALGLAAIGAVAMIVAALWGAFLAATRTRCMVTEKQLIVRGLARERIVPLATIARVAASRDRLLHCTLVVDHAGGRLVVRDIQSAESAVTVIESMARVAKKPDLARGNEVALVEPDGYGASRERRPRKASAPFKGGLK